MTHDRRRQREADIAAKEAAYGAFGLGLRDQDPPYDGDDKAWHDWKAFHRRRDMVRFSGEADTDADRESDISDRLFELLNQAMAIRATTVAGLAVQLRAFDLACRDFVDQSAHSEAV